MGTSVDPADWRRQLCALLLILLAAATGTAPAAAPAGADARLEEVGRGRLTRLGFQIFGTSPWSVDGRWSGLEPSRPVVLSLADRRGYSRAELIRITAGEFARLGLADPDARARGSEHLQMLRHDVGPGDTKTAVVVSGGATRFDDGNRPLGAIEDPAFGPADLSIWLDPRSAVRDLRTEILGSGAH